MTDTLDNLFDDADLGPVVDPNKDHLTELVGDGKKFKDNKALALAKAESDAFIVRLTKETQRLREELSKSKTLEDVMTQIRASAPKEPVLEKTNSQEGTDSKITPEQIAELVTKQVQTALTDSQKEALAKTNLEQVKAGLVRVWGTDYVPKLEAEAAKLGVGRDFVTSIGRVNPTALFKLLGVEPGKKEAGLSPPPPSSVSSSGFTGSDFSGEKTEKYYQKLRKDSPDLYNSPRIQNERHEQALKLREAFFDA